MTVIFVFAVLISGYAEKEELMASWEDEWDVFYH